MSDKSTFKFIQHQKIMGKVLVALVPCICGSVYFFGWSSLFIIILANISGYITEYLFLRKQGKPVSEAIFVTSTLFALVMPPSVPWYVVVIGMIFSTMFGKMVFGGFGKNIFNPAITGRAFVYVCFPLALTSAWPSAADGTWGALGKWSTVSSVETISGASLLSYMKSGQIKLDSNSANEKIPYDLKLDETVSIKPGALFKTLLVGRISGTMGVTSVILILIGGIYLIITKTVNRTLLLSVVAAYAFWSQALFWFGVESAPSAWPALMGGGFLFGAFFMVTDPVSSPKTQGGRIMYGILIGTSTMVINNFSIFNGGLMFSILIGNMFAPTFDNVVKWFNSKIEVWKNDSTN